MSSPIVGTAYVRVQTVSAGLGREIADAVLRQLGVAQPHINRAMNKSGQQAGQNMSRGLTRATRTFNRIGDQIGKRFSNRFILAANNALFRKWLPNLSKGLDKGLTRFSRNTADRLVKGISPARFFRSGQDLAEQLHRGFNLGIGAARMGPAVISALTLALPSIVGGASALGTSLAGALFAGIAAAGPGLLGGTGVLAALGTGLLGNFLLLSGALKSSVDGMKELSQEAKALKDGLVDPVATGLLQGFRSAIATLNAKLLPQLNGLLTKTGEAYGKIATKIAETIASSKNLERIKSIFQTNLRFVDNLGTGLDGLAESFIILLNAAKPFFDYIGDGIAKFGDWARKTLEAKEANGELAEFMNGILESFKQLMSIVGNIGSGIKGIFEAALPTGQKLLDKLELITDRFDKWVNSDKGQAKLSAFFEKSAVLAGAVARLFGALARSLGNAFVNLDTGPILAVLDTLEKRFVPAISKIFSQIQEGAGDNLVKIFENISGALERLAESGVLKEAAELFSDLLVAITGFLDTEFGAKILAIIAPLLLFGGFFSSLIGPITSVASLLTSGAFLSAAGIIGGIATAFILVWKNSEKFRDAIKELVTLVGGKLTEIWDKISPKIERFWEALQELAGAIGDRLGPAISALLPVISNAFDVLGRVLEFIIDHITLVVEFFTAIIDGDWSKAWEKFKEIFQNAWQFVQDILGGVLSWIWEKIQEFFGLIVGFFVTWGENIKAQWNQIWDNVISFFRTWGQNIVALARQIWETVKQAIFTVVEVIRSWLVERWNSIKAYIGQVWDGIVRWAQEKWALVVSTIRGIVQPIVTWLSQRWEDIKNAAGRAWDTIVGWASEKWNAVTSAIKTAIEGVKEWLAGIWEDIKSAATNAWNLVASAARTAWGAVYDAIIQPIQNAYNWVADKVGAIVGIVEGALSRVRQLASDIAAAVTNTNPGNLGPGQFGLPGAAEGGYVNPTPGGFPIIVAEGGQRERIEPLESNGLSRRDAAMISHIIESVTASQKTGGGPINVSVKIGERELNDIMDIRIQRDRAQMARKLRNGVRLA